MRRIAPGLMLFFLAPILGELVSGTLSPLEFFNPLIFLITIVPYGCAALITHEVMTRRMKGLVSLLLLGLAYGLFFEGIITRVIFNPNWEGLGALAEYGHVYGVNWTLAIGLVHFHCVISILAAILLTEMMYPSRRHESWISKPLLIGCVIALPAWTIVLALLSPYMPPLPGAILVVLLTAALVFAALRIPEQPFTPHGCPTPPPIVFGLLGVVNMSLVMVGVFILPEIDIRPPLVVTMLALLVLDMVSFALLMRWSDSGAAWDDRHRFALIVGLLSFFILFGFVQDIGESFTGSSIVSVVTVVLLWRLGRRVTTDSSASLLHGKGGLQ